jgi:hypothetical protein
MFPLLCPRWWADAPDRVHITEGVQIRKILDHIGGTAHIPWRAGRCG